MKCFRKIYVASSILVFYSAFGFADAGTLCEFNLLSSRAETGFAKTFRDNVRDRVFALKSVNPNAGTEAVERLGLSMADLNGLTLKFVQLFGEIDPMTAVTLQYRSPLGRADVLGSRLHPATFWAEADMKYEDLQGAVEREGGGLTQNQQVQDLVTQHMVPGSIRQGLVVEERSDGTRTYFNFRKRGQSVELVVGLDLPCAEAGKYLLDNKQPERNLMTDKQPYCRIPVLEFEPKI